MTIFERNRFKKFVRSPFFNEDESLVLVNNYLCYRLKRKQSWPSNQTIWQHIHTKSTPYNDTKCRRYLSDLNLLAERFLVVAYRDASDELFYTRLLPLLREKELSKHFQAANRSLKRSQAKQVYQNASYHLSRFRAEYQDHLFRQKEGLKRSRNINLEAADYHLDLFFIISKLRLYAESLNYSTILNLELELPLIEPLLEWLPTSPYQKNEVVCIWMAVIQTFILEPPEQAFIELQQLLKKHRALLTDEEINELYIYVINFAIRKINSGETEYYNAFFSIMMEMIQSGVALYNGNLAPWHYKNLVSAGIRLKRFDEVKDIIHNYSHYLPADYRQNAESYNLAKLLFAEEKYPDVLSLLHTVEYQDIFYVLGSKLLLIQTYFEMEEYEALDSLLASFAAYLRRTKEIPKARARQYMSSLKFVQQLLKIAPLDHKKRQKLYTKIAAHQGVADKAWLLKHCS